MMSSEDTSDTAMAAQPGLDELRVRIDAVDAELLALLNRRADISLAVGRLKASTGAPVLRPDREAALLQKLQAANPGPLPAAHLLAIYREILSSSRALQRDLSAPLRVACLGPEGTFSFFACQDCFGSSIQCLPMPHFSDIFDAVVKGACDYGMVPMENSLNGTVGQTLDLFADYRVHVHAEHYSRIHLSLMSREADLSAVQAVCSHPQPLGQCARWLREHLPKARQMSFESTALAAERCLNEPGSAAIGDARLAERFGLHVLERGIEDLPDNVTRFFVIAKEPLPQGDRGSGKTSVTFVLPDKAGALAAVLAALAEGGVNLTKLESRPLRGEGWRYRFFADLDSTDHAALQRAAGLCQSWRVLGVYPAAG